MNLWATGLVVYCTLAVRYRGVSDAIGGFLEGDLGQVRLKQGIYHSIELVVAVVGHGRFVLTGR